MPVTGWRSVSVRSQVLERLETQYNSQKEQLEKEKNITSFSSYVSNILMDMVERSEILSRYAPFMSEIGITDNRIILDDKKTGSIVEIILMNKELFCRDCQRNDCIHVGFAYSIPIVNKTLREQGVTEQKVRE